jgi:glycosyltransferase involved in cell wall biosynthesis
MRVLIVAALITDDNRYGGPSIVAKNHAKWLSNEGHEISLVGLGDEREVYQGEGSSALRTVIFKARRLPGASSFSKLFSFRLALWLFLNRNNFDVAHIHLARDLVTLPSAWLLQRLGIPTFVQTHGMISPSSRMAAKVLDILLVKGVLVCASTVFYLTTFERRSLLKVAGDRHNVNLAYLPNAVDYPPRLNLKIQRNNQIVFVSRLEKRKQPIMFVELAQKFPSIKFIMAGADQGELNSVRKRAYELKLGNFQYIGPLSHPRVLDLLAKSKALILPAYGEVFPMIVLEALSLGTPVVMSDQCGLADTILDCGGGRVSKLDLASFVSSLTEVLEDDRMPLVARELVKKKFSPNVVLSDLLAHYSREKFS